MGNAINFLVESGVSLAVLSLIYVLFLRKETFFRKNRLFLLGSVAFSIVLPFLHFGLYAPREVMLKEVTVTPYRNLIETVTIYGQDLSLSIVQRVISSQGLLVVYLLGTLFFLLRFWFRLSQVLSLISDNLVRQKGKIKYVLLREDFSPFSFLNFVFINPKKKSEPGYESMIEHEAEHIRQGHTCDVLLLEILSVFQWFNPFLWILKKAVRENHEYLADRAVLNTGVNVAFYKQLLLGQALGIQLELANNFNSSLIKKRIKMISKIRSSKIANLKYFAGILSIVALFVLFACDKKETNNLLQATKAEVAIKLKYENGQLMLSNDDRSKLEQIIASGAINLYTDSLGNTYLSDKTPSNKVLHTNKMIFNVVDDMPKYPGGDEALRDYLQSSIEYPDVAIESNIEGKVYVSFVVDTNGAVKYARVIRGVDTNLDKEALRVVNNMPTWIPGKQKGVPVNVNYTVPIKFALE